MPRSARGLRAPVVLVDPATAPDAGTLEPRRTPPLTKAESPPRPTLPPRSRMIGSVGLQFPLVFTPPTGIRPIPPTPVVRGLRVPPAGGCGVTYPDGAW